MRVVPNRLHALTLSVLMSLSVAATCDEVVHEVIIRDYTYVPAELSIKTGATVTWTNHEKRTSHSIRFVGDDGFESERIFPDESWSYTFSTPGTYVYSCGPHPEMHGKIIVTD
ncbi:MAG: cupredoxin domain-containing protein [Gammaproteobacteria bacterium]|nr:cupredoxin domain-containing protein [Gammaproteobacteria bacterium]